jgi:drug/metabolite transporter (DMT)-like permease
MHVTSGRWRLGLSLAVVTALLWGTLPLALKVALQQIDGITITWCRFTVSAIVLLALRIRRDRGVRARRSELTYRFIRSALPASDPVLALPLLPLPTRGDGLLRDRFQLRCVCARSLPA